MFTSITSHNTTVYEFVNYICERYSKRWKNRRPLFIIQNVHGLYDMYRGYPGNIPDYIFDLELVHNYIVRRDSQSEYYVLLVSEYEYLKYGMN